MIMTEKEKQEILNQWYSEYLLPHGSELLKKNKKLLDNK